MGTNDAFIFCRFAVFKADSSANKPGGASFTVAGKRKFWGIDGDFMKKCLMTTMLTAAILAGGAGCNTSIVMSQPPAKGQTSSTGARVVANLEGGNWGLFLFYGIPLWSGNPNRPNRRDYITFQNRIKNKYTTGMLKGWARQMNAEVEDIQIRDFSTGAFSLWIFWRRSQTVTAVAVEKK